MSDAKTCFRYGKSFGAALTTSLNFDVKKKEKNQKSGGCPHPQEANGMTTSHEESNEEIEQPPWPIATSSQLPILTDKTWCPYSLVSFSFEQAIF